MKTTNELFKDRFNKSVNEIIQGPTTLTKCGNIEQCGAYQASAIKVLGIPFGWSVQGNSPETNGRSYSLLFKSKASVVQRMAEDTAIHQETVNCLDQLRKDDPDTGSVQVGEYTAFRRPEGWAVFEKNTDSAPEKFGKGSDNAIAYAMGEKIVRSTLQL